MEPLPRAPFVICITGPESIGKTHLSHALSERTGAQLVEEFVREYAGGKTNGLGPWIDIEYLLVAEEQARRQTATVEATRAPIVVCDTDAYTVWIWHRFYTNPPVAEIESIAMACLPDLYVLPSIADTEYVFDGVRDPVAIPRAEVWRVFVVALEGTGRPLLIVSGDVDERIAQVLAEVARLRDPDARAR